MVMKIDDSLEHFCVEWEKWENAIMNYSKASKSKPAYLQRVLNSTNEEDPGMVFNVCSSIYHNTIYCADAFTLSAFKCLSYFLVPKQRRRVESEMSGHCVIPSLLMEASVSMSA